MKEVIKTVLNQDPTEVLSVVPLSNDAVTRRIDELGQNVEMQLCEELKIPAISQINLKKRYSEIINSAASIIKRVNDSCKNNIVSSSLLLGGRGRQTAKIAQVGARPKKVENHWVSRSITTTGWQGFSLSLS